MHVPVMCGAQCNTDHMMLRLYHRRCLHVPVMCGAQCNTDHMMLRLYRRRCLHDPVMCGGQCNTDHMTLKGGCDLGESSLEVIVQDIQW